MSADIKKVLVLDSRLDCSDQITYAVMQGAQSMNPAPFRAVSESASSHTYNIQVPAETVIVDRRLMWNSTVRIVVSGIPPVGQYNVNYGVTDALAPFPLHQLVSVMTAQINNNSVSLNVRDVLASLLRFHDRRELARYNGMTPTAVDTYQKYSDGVGANNNPLGAYQNSTDIDLVSRGSYVLDYLGENTDFTTNNGVQTIGDGATTKNTCIQFTVSEPLLISPFLSADPKSNAQGFYGIQNMNFQFSMGDATRVFRTASSWAKTVTMATTVPPYVNSQLLFNFLTPHASQLLASRNVVPYAEFPRYITSFNSSIGSGQSFAYKSSTLQLNVIPDKLIIFVRKAISTQTSADTDSFLTLNPSNPLSISFNNVSGILSSASLQDLYRYSIENGSNQSWLEFSGYANVANQATGSGTKRPLSGSLLVLEFGKDIPLQEAYFSAGSLGSFSLQVSLNCTNQSASAIASQELVIITMNSGVMSLERGSASVFTGLLTKSDVLEATAQTPYYKSDATRMVGGGFMDNLKSIIGKVLPLVMPQAKKYLREQGDIGEKAEKVVSALGYGKSGGKMKLAERMM
jgi:hypothetical protein